MHHGDVLLQKISIPTPWKVNRNFRGKRVSRTHFVKGKYGTKIEFPERVGGFKLKDLPLEG